MSKTHKHHLKPRHEGGTDDPSNLLEVTIADHAIIHEARWYAYHHWQDYCAWKVLSGHMTMDEATAMALREGCKAGGRSRKGKKNLNVSKIMQGNKHAAGTIKTEKVKYEHSCRMQGSGNSMYGRKHTEESKQKMRDNNWKRRELTS